MKKHIVFLDFDGVLNSTTWYGVVWDSVVMGEGDLPPGCDKDFDPENVRAVAQLIRALDADVVVSSSWRHLPEVPDRLVKVGLPRPVGITPDDPERIRGKEIAAWLALHPEVEDYLILDDDVDDIQPYHNGHVVKTSVHAGFTEDLLKGVLAALRNRFRTAPAPSLEDSHA